MSVIVIDLNDVTEGGTIHNLAGKERGESVRKHFALDEIDHSDESVVVMVPEELYGISSSFFLGMFSPSIERLGGEEGFLEKYRFDADTYLMQQILHGIRRATMTREPLTVDA